MPGMDSGLDAANPVLVAAFRSALLHQLIIVAAAVVVLALGYLVARNRWAAHPRPVPPVEPKSRQFLRVAFGILWIFDAILQAQPEMAGGLPSQIVEPIASASPGWVQHAVNFGGAMWSYHPVQAAAAAVWIQAGLGVWLIAAATGWSSRLAGLAGAGWGLVVWVFGEAFGGIFAPGLSWLNGAPGAVVLYVVAGALIALPLRAWAGPRLGRLLLAGIGVSWVGMAVLQAWPGRGFWQGGDSGALPGMVSAMAQISQPHAQAAMVAAFASFTGTHAFAVNLFVVVVLAALGAALASGQPRLVRVAVPAATVFCVADWVLVQDLGFPGGLGTDPNSMIPWVLLLWGGFLALTGRTVPASAESPATTRPTTFRRVLAAASPRSLAAVAAVGVILLGAVPMTAALVDRQADPIIARAIAGAPVRLDRPAPDFRLTSGESGQPVSLASLRGKMVLLTFLDPVCTGCPQIAQQLHAASTLLGTAGDRVELVAIAASTMHSRVAFIRAFDRNQGLTTVPDWLFLTGTPAELQEVWNTYEKVAPGMMAGMMVHSEIVFVIDRNGRIRWEVREAPGPTTQSAQSSFAVLLADATR
jgi:cytochrome oxidase Cu insertion factor (SCO1/SenC/PrrC family)